MEVRITRWLCVLAVALLASACASRGGTPHPFPRPDVARSATSGPEVGTSNDAMALVGIALELRGTPYRNGGADLRGFDCSGFTQYVFSRQGLTLPREVRDQFGLGHAVPQDHLAPGDLIFFSINGRGPSHVAIAVDGDQFVHAPSARGVVRIERVSSRYWARRLVGIRRIAP